MRKKICFVTAVPGTANGFLKGHIENLSKDYDVYFIADIQSSDDVTNMHLAGYKSIKILRKPTFMADLKALLQMYRYFRVMKFDAVQSQASNPSLLMAVAAKMAGVPVRIRMFTGQLWMDWTGLKRFLFKSMDRLTVLCNTHLLTDGKPQMRYLIDEKIVSADKIRVLGNGSICGVDISKFNPDPSIRKQVRDELGYTDNNVVYTFLGRLREDKGIAEQLEAFNLLYKGHPGARLLLIGRDEGGYEPWLDKYPTLKKDGVVRFYGYTTEPYRMIQAGDVALMPSYQEGFGMAAIEQSCMKLPLICSDTFGLEDSIIDGVTGLICKRRDVHTLFECMEKLYGDKQMRELMGEEGRKYVAQYFSKEIVEEAWVDFYKELLSKK